MQRNADRNKTVSFDAIFKRPTLIERRKEGKSKIAIDGLRESRSIGTRASGASTHDSEDAGVTGSLPGHLPAPGP